MGQYRTHVFVCTSGDDCPTRGDVEAHVKFLRAEALRAGLKTDVRVNKAGCFSQCGHGPMIVVYPDDVWYAGVKESDLKEIFQRLKKTVLLVTHDMGEAAYLGDEIAIMKGGRLLQRGSFRELLERPADPFVAEFIRAQRPPGSLEAGVPA